MPKQLATSICLYLNLKVKSLLITCNEYDSVAQSSHNDERI